MPHYADLRLPPMPKKMQAQPPRARAQSRTGRVLLVLGCYALLAAAWGWRFQEAATSPEADAAMEARLKRIASYLSHAPKETVPAILSGVMRMSEAQLLALDAWLLLPPLDQLRRITTQESMDLIHTNADLRDALLLAWLGQEFVAAPYEAHLMIAAAGDRLDPRVVLHAYELLAATSASQRDYGVAAAILQRAVEMPGAGWDAMRHLLDAARLHGQPSSALRPLHAWIKRQKSGATTTDDELNVALDAEALLLLQLDRAPEALDKQIRLLNEAGIDQPVDTQTLERAITCARASGELLRLVPWLERALAAPEAAPGRHLRWARILASVCDQELPAAAAYDAFARLFQMGDAALALPRMAALATAAKREKNFEQTLLEMLHTPEGRSHVEALAAALHLPAQRALTRAQFVTVRQAQKHTPP